MIKRQSQQGIQSIEVGNAVLAALAAAGQPLMLKDLAKAARMSAPKAHRYLVSYARIGLVEQEAGTGRYELGSFALELGLAALGRLDPVVIASRYLRDLAVAIDQTTALAVWANHGATIVRWAGSDSLVSATLRVGSVMPLSRSATGLLFCALQSLSQSMPLLKTELAENAARGLRPQTLEEIEPLLAEIRRNGYSRTNTFSSGITGLAAPVFAADGTLAIALTTLGYSERFDEMSLRSTVLAKAQEISQRLGHKG